jgi:hypothetical protein
VGSTPRLQYDKGDLHTRLEASSFTHQPACKDDSQPPFGGFIAHFSLIIPHLRRRGALFPDGRRHTAASPSRPPASSPLRGLPPPPKWGLIRSPDLPFRVKQAAERQAKSCTA